MNRKRFLKNTVAMTALTLGTLPAGAICATPYPVTVTQPDGTQITLTMRGDEKGYVMLTSDGYAVMPNTLTGRYEFAVPEGNTFRCLGVQAQEPGMRPAETEALLATLDRDAIIPALDKARSAATMRKAPMQRVKISNYPTIGHQKALVILVEFEDTKFTTIPDAYDYYNRMLNEEGFTWDNGANGSARDFYLASSDGMFDPEFTVIGPVTLDKPSAYYGGDSSIYIDENVIDMVMEACVTADDSVDFSEYDADGDGYVDNIYFFYAGYGQADSGRADAVWPHSGTIEESWERELILDGVHLNRYACSNEIRGGSGSKSKPVGIGTFVHEFGHVLGIADHYDTAYSSGRTGVNDWDTMAGASYFNDQNTPPLFNTFERAELGWMEYTDIPATTAGWIDLPTIDLGAKAYRFVVDGTDGREYFILEARQKRGWDEYLPGHGMLVWHVDMDEEKWWSNTLNNDGRHQNFDLIEADKKENDSSYAADPFPGKNNVTSFEFKNWAGNVEFLLDHIIETDDNIRLLLGGTEYMPERPELNIHRVGGKTLQFSWMAVEDAQHYCVSLRDEDGNAIENLQESVFETPSVMSVESLEPFTTYTLELYAKTGSYRSEIASHTFTTSDLCFFEYTPVFNQPSDIKGESFMLTWEPLEGATDYMVSLDEMSYGETTTSESDFSEIPEGWETSSSKYNKALFGKKSPALQFDNDKDYLLFTGEGGLISKLTFWVRSQSATNILLIEYRGGDDAEWTTLEEQALKTSAQTLSFDIPDASDVRLVYQKKSGYVLIDDIVCEYSPLSWAPVDNYAEILTGGECGFMPKNLQGYTTYQVSLAGICGGEMSRKAITRVTTGEPSGVISATTAAEIVSRLDISGRAVGKGYKGIVIERLSDGAARKTMIK